MSASIDRDQDEKQDLQVSTGLTSNFSLYDLRRAYYGGGLSTTDRIRAYLQTQTGLTTNQSLNDLWRQFFLGQGIANQVSLGDMARSYFDTDPTPPLLGGTAGTFYGFPFGLTHAS